MRKCVVGTQMVHQPTEERPLGPVCTYVGISWISTMEWSAHAHAHSGWARPEATPNMDIPVVHKAPLGTDVEVC